MYGTLSLSSTRPTYFGYRNTLVTLQAAPIVELPASASGAARFSARAAESTPARNFFHLRFIAKASLFHPILLQEKSSTVHF